MTETQVSDVRDLPTSLLATSALLAEKLLDKPLNPELAERVRDRRKVFLDELVARGALAPYSFV